uniref:Uncharacterized protein n=1 Tax=uncultured prokaryote TaxID=198431 RepID=A0A0H5QN98_9ZZZZ|nr:hypothetical protein [uncultured prokaryote]
MAETYRAQVTIPMFTGKPRDVMTNTFHFVDALEGDPEASLVEIQDQLKDFYDTAYTTTASNRANYLVWANATLRIANLAEAIPRTIYEMNMGFAPGSGASPEPTEMAIVASWRAAPVPGIRYQSLYNRVYLGGMAGVMTSSTAASFPTINAAICARINNAMIGLHSRTFDPLQVKWVQYGMNGPGGEGTARPIIGGFTDNSPDTQRRRSVDYSIRYDWVPTP